MEILFLLSLALAAYPGRAARAFVIVNRLTGGKNRSDRLPELRRAIRWGSLAFAALYLLYLFVIFHHR